MIEQDFIYFFICIVVQAVTRSPPATGILSSHLGHFMWVSWWTKLGLDRFFLRSSHSTISILPVAVYDGCGIVAFVYWFGLKQYL